MIGLTLANLLRNVDLRIAIIDSVVPKEVDDSIDMRVSAINRSSVDIFKITGAWSKISSKRVSPFRSMHVWDSTGAGSIHFDSAESGLDSLGYIIENSVIQQALLNNITGVENIDWLCPKKVDSIVLSESTADALHRVYIDDGDVLECKLLVGADGANSLVREVAGIELKRDSYQQSAIVCTVATEEPHVDTAWQCFLPSGPLAFLPLWNGDCSIVWSMDDARIEELLTLNDAAFCRRLEEAFQFQLGKVESVSKRASFPLGHGHVDYYIRPGVALVGDAAHTIHPLAGQGANLGFHDVACLAEVIVEAKRKQRQWYASHTLRKYERTRKGENRLMESTMSGFKYLFCNENPLLSTLRNAGLGIVDHLPLLKEQLMNYAIGHN